MVTKAELEERVEILESRLSILERRMRTISRSLETEPTDDDRDRVRLNHIIRILRKFNGEATLDQISAENDSITKAGTRAQLVRLIKIGDVEQPSRGTYALVRR